MSARSSRRRGAVALLVAGTTVALGPIPSLAGSDSGSGPRLKVALRVDGRCGAFTSRLPPLVNVRDLEPGQTTTPTQLCIATRGSPRARLFLSSVDTESTETGCTGDEAAVDNTCGSGQGELDSALTVLVAVQNGCRGRFGAKQEVPFAALAQQPVELPGVGGPGRMDCLALSLRHDGTSLVESSAAQSDAVRWRYAFDLVG